MLHITKRCNKLAKPTFNDAQQSAIDSDAKRLLVLAGAGTGKTFTMLGKINKLVRQLNVDPASILVLTFTNAAAFEMKDRYMKNSNNTKCPEFRTFHSFCYSLIVSDIQVRLKLGYNKIPKVASDDDVASFKTKAKMIVGTKLSIKQMNLPDNKLSQTAKQDKQLFWKQFGKLLKQSGLITFDKLCYGVCKLFVNDDECIKQYKEKYKYIFVDEYQDTDSNQNDFVMSFENSNIFVVGDALQALYSFRGADSSLIKQLASNPDWQTVKLTENYRSTKEICDCANNMSNYADETYRIQINGHSEGDAPKFYKIYEPNYNEKVPNYVIQDILKDLNSIDGTSAILCRTNAEVSYLIDELNDSGIRPRTGKRNVDAINLLKSVLDADYRTNWLSTFLNASQYAEYIRLCYLRDKETESESTVLIKYYGKTFQIQKRATQINEVMRILKSNSLKFQKCADILKVLELPQDIEVDCEVSKASEFINNLIDAIQEDFESDVYVGTIHSAKGLEYDNVFLVNVDTKLFPLDNEDNLNLYYVGITRAKSYLKIYKGGI